MPQYLPNTSLTSMSIGPRIFAYAQGYHGQLIEAQGRLNNSGEHADVYYANGQTSIGPTTRWRDKVLQPHAPKMFTPLAAASLEDTRYLIYVDDDNILHDVVYKDSEWKPGTLSEFRQGDRIGIRCAPYSKLAAATVPIEGNTIICVYYQTTEKHGPVSMITFLPGNSWTELIALLQLLYSLRDPPLYGTSLSAVKPRPGICLEQRKKKGDEITAEQSKTFPVVYLQWDTHALAHGQGKTIRPIPGLEEFGLSPHTSLSVVDDGTNLYCFYITNANKVEMIRIDQGQATAVIDDIVSPTPRSAIAAVMPLQQQDRIILFYQVWDTGDSEKIDIKAETFARGSGGADDWQSLLTTDLMDG